MEDIINFNEDFAAVHAYLCADGYVCKVNPKRKHYRLGLRNTNLTLLNDFKTRFKNVFGVDSHIYKKLDSCSLGSKASHQYLIDNFGSFHSYEWTMPIKHLNKSTCSIWLRAFFDCEAWVVARKAKDREIAVDSVNLKGLHHIQKCLKDYFDISSVIKPRKNRTTHTLYIFSKDNLIKFRKHIGFLHDAKKQKLDDAIASFVDYNWKFPKSKHKLKEFVKSKMKERAKIHKPGYVQMCSIVKENLTDLSFALDSLFSIKANVYGPRKNKRGTIYYEFTIARKDELQKIVKNDLLSEKQKAKLTHSSLSQAAI